MKVTDIFIAVAFLAIPVLTARADESKPSYDAVEVGWTQLHAHNPGRGVALNASVSLSDNVFFYGSAGSVDFIGSDEKAKSWKFGAGFHSGISETLDLVGRAAGQHVKEGGIGSYGTHAEIGLKVKPKPSLESWVMIGRSQWNGRHQEDQATLRMGLQYEFNHRFGLVGDALIGQHEDEYFAGLSYLF